MEWVKNMKEKRKVLLRWSILFAAMLFFLLLPKSYAVEEVLAPYYKVVQKGGKNYLFGIPSGTTVESVTQNVICNETVTIYNANQVAAQTEKVRGGMYCTVNGTNYYFIASGDINEDGNITQTDLLQLKKQIVHLTNLKDESYLAADVNGDGNVTSTDVLQIKRVLVNLLKLESFYTETISNESYRYTKFKATNTIKLEEYIGAFPNTLTIPEQIDGLKVGGISKEFITINNSIHEIQIPAQTLSIPAELFSNCTNLSNIIVASNNTMYKSQDGVLYTKDGRTLVTYPVGKSDTSFIVPQGVGIIMEEAFSNVKYCQEVFIPNQVTSIKNGAFSGFKGTIYGDEDGEAIRFAKANNLSYIVDKPPVVEQEEVTLVGQGTSADISFFGKDDGGIIAWAVTKATETNPNWNTVSQAKGVNGKQTNITENGTYIIWLKDILNHISKTEINVTNIDSTVPTITSIKIISPASGGYRTGQVVTIRVQFSEKVKGVAPSLILKVGDVVAEGSVTADNPTGTQDYIDYSYTITGTHTGEITIADYTGGSITDLANNTANITKLDNTGNTITVLPNETNRGTFEKASFTTNINGGTQNWRYWLYVPELSEVGTYENIPLIVYLHGKYQSGKDLDLVTGVSLPKYLKEGTVKPKAIVVAPQSPDQGFNWNPNPDSLSTPPILKLIEHIKTQFNINEDKISITGHSFGARGVWQLAQKNLNTFSAVVPVSFVWTDVGVFDEKDDRPRCPVRFYFATEDADKNKTAVRNYITKVNESLAGRYTDLYTTETIPNTSHGSVVEIYQNTNILEWMIQQTRGEINF